MFKALLITRFAALWNSMFARLSSKQKDRGLAFKILIALFALYVVSCLFFSFGLMMTPIVKPLSDAKLDWLYFSINAVVCIALCFIGSIFTTQAQLFEAKDNELLLSMPVPTPYILTSRMIMLLVMNYVFSLFVFLPSGVVYFTSVGPNAIMILLFIIAALLIPIFSMALTCFCGWLIALISSKLRYKNLFTTIFMLAFLLGYLYIYFNLQNYMAELLLNGVAIGEAIKAAFPPVYYFGTAIANTDIVSLLILALWCLVPFAFIYIILSRFFISIATSKKGLKKIAYKEKSLKVSNIRGTLLKKELKKFFSLPMYILNSGLGAVMALLLSGALIIKGPDLISVFIDIPEISGYIPVLLCIALSFVATTTCTTAPSISLEGKSFWILKAHPINPGDVFYAKVMTKFN